MPVRVGIAVRFPSNIELLEDLLEYIVIFQNLTASFTGSP